jgi:hypothetical protein
VKLVVVTASLDAEKTREYWESWAERAVGNVSVVWVRPKEAEEDEERIIQEGDYYIASVLTDGIVGVVPAFAAGVKKAEEFGADIIACFHDDLRIDEKGWDQKIKHWFQVEKKCGLAGFFGARHLGAGDIYQTPYSPMQLARGECGSNMLEAEKHGERWLTPRKVACFDGFSQIGRAGLMGRLYRRLEQLGVKHHAYDSALGAMSIREGWENWFLPIACHHAGGLTAVANEKYQAWAKGMDPRGDQAFWEESHRICYEELRGVLPLVVVG